LARLILLLTLLTMIVACGATPPPTASAPTSPSGPASEAVTVAPTEAAPAEPPTPVNREAAAGRSTIIEVWYPYGGDRADIFEKYWKAFEDSHPDIGIKAVFAANDLSTNAKLFTAIAAGNPPDVTWVDGPQVAEWAARGALEPLDEMIAAGGVNKDDFWPLSWGECVYNNKVWALSYTADPAFGLFWNKDIFREAGLDPEKPPTTVEEMDQMNDKIAKVNNGRIERLGFIPWTVYGASNSIFTWGWIFGGEFYNPETQKITANDPKVVKALEWMGAFAKKYNPEQLSGFQAGFGSGEQNPFYQGKIAMALFGSWELPGLKKYAPNLKYGIAPLPTGPDGAPPNQTWGGGWDIGIPKGAKHKEAAFEFIKWMTTSTAATDISGTDLAQFVSYRKAPYYEKIKQDPELKFFYDIMVNVKHYRPVMPAQAFYTGELQRAVDAVIFGQKTAQQALDDATNNTQKELDRILKEGIK